MDILPSGTEDRGYTLAPFVTPLAAPAEREPSAEGAPSAVRGALAGWSSVVVLFALHSVAAVGCLGGVGELASGWPIPWHDHPMHLHNAWVTPSFLSQNGTTAGYDPYFMGGYAKSIVSDPSSTMLETAVAALGRKNPVVVYKLVVLYAIASIPFWVAWAVVAAGGGGRAAGAAVFLSLVYLWTDFPLEYAGFGMVAYLLVVPVTFVLGARIGDYLDRGGFRRWLEVAVGAGLTLWIHPLCLMVVGPGAGIAYLAAAASRDDDGKRMPWTRHLGLWALPIVSLAANAWWWWPALGLSGTGEARDFAFVHSNESVWGRLGQIVGLTAPVQPEIQAVLIGAGLLGARASRGIGRGKRTCLLTMVGAGFFWGYLAGWFPRLDPLQPGRQTYTFYLGAAILAGLAWEGLLMSVRRRQGPRWGLGLTVAGLLVGLRLFGAPVMGAVEYRTGWKIARAVRPERARPAYLSSRPDARLLELVERVKDSFPAGSRIYYEEGGAGKPGLADPFGGQRFGGLLPYLTGVEVIGGPYVGIPVKTNFTQVGMGRLFGEDGWNEERWREYARIYRPDGVVCWSPGAKAFCRDHADLVEVIRDDGFYLVGRVLGLSGQAVRGEAQVEASAGRLVVRMESADVDGKVVLGYHSAPGLKIREGGGVESELQADDPVPLIRLPFRPEPITVELDPRGFRGEPTSPTTDGPQEAGPPDTSKEGDRHRGVRNDDGRPGS